MSDHKDIDDVTGIDTTGHEWDGIKELNNPLPRWWLWTLYICIVWAIGYTIAFPAWPLLSSATTGVLGFSTRGQVADEIAAVDAANAEVSQKLAAADLSQLPSTDPAYSYGVQGGRSVFIAHCSQCHGSGAAGNKGPNLLDDDWLWGGTVEDIEYSVRHGIRNETDDARYSEMPAFGDIFEEAEIVATTEYVLQISGQEHDAELATLGAELFADNCTSCHGESGEGMREMGAPRLSDAIWFYGGDRETVYHSIKYARYGVMPAWGLRLDEDEIKAVTLYVHQLGGGE